MTTVASTTLFAVIVAVSNAIVAVFGYLLSSHNSKVEKKKEK